MSHYTVSLPNYSIGTDCYQDIPHITRFFGRRAVVIGGRTALAKARPLLERAVVGSGVELVDFLWYGGDSTYENGDALVSDQRVQGADMIFGVGGGRACDTVKYVADKLDKPLFTFPTLASNCAAVTAISVMYNPDGTFRDYYYPKLADHCFIESGLLADSPERLLWAGIGDALSKEWEAVFASRDDALSHTPLMGVQLSRVCTDPLVQYGAQALEAVRQKKVTYELEQVALDIIISTGIVSNMTTTVNDYYYNSTLAHCVYYGATVTPGGHKHLHGEVVALGVLCLLEYAQNTSELERLLRFNRSIGLPVCFDEIDIAESEFDTMSDKFTRTTEWAHRPKGVTREDVLEAMRRLNAKGRALLAAAKA